MTVTCRRPELAPPHWHDLGIRVLRNDREDVDALDDLVGDGLDGIVDGQCYSPAHAADLARWSTRCEGTVMLSSRAVYVDALGNHANSDVRPVWDRPTSEENQTLDYAGEPWNSREGYGTNKAEAERVLAASGRRVSVLRPARIHGPSTRRVREWPLLAALLAGTRRILVQKAEEAGSLTSTLTISRAVSACLRAPDARKVNVADAPTATNLEVARILASSWGAEAEIVAAGDGGPVGGPGIASEPEPGTALIPGAWATGQELEGRRLTELIGTPPEVRSTLERTAGWVGELARRAPDGHWELPEQFDGS
ncbi:hypothetical protein DEO23_07935 [Brachybacterium endophyticum]|uniref:Reductase n=1 Tax=Brachybacterium endophyticum TaxID=2182385 RepID=A0A2U2RLW9_9MICO|nr:hypothetical protein DEO23_07935 [Brachybacterium endophyticum]